MEIPCSEETGGVHVGEGQEWGEKVSSKPSVPVEDDEPDTPTRTNSKWAGEELKENSLG